MKYRTRATINRGYNSFFPVFMIKLYIKNEIKNKIQQVFCGGGYNSSAVNGCARMVLTYLLLQVAPKEKCPIQPETVAKPVLKEKCPIKLETVAKPVPKEKCPIQPETDVHVPLTKLKSTAFANKVCIY